MQRFGALEVAIRQNDFAFEVQAYLKTHLCAAGVNLGCGLYSTGKACDLNDTAWFSERLAHKRDVCPGHTTGAEGSYHLLENRSSCSWAAVGQNFL